MSFGGGPLIAALEDLDAGALAEYLAGKSGAHSVRIESSERLSGGAIQENWKLRVYFDGGPEDGVRNLVVRTDSAAAIAASRPRAEEFQLLQAAHEAGVRVPEPLWLEETGRVLGKPFYVMRHVAGVAAGHLLVKPGAVGDGDALAEELGAQLARIHGIRPAEAGLAFLGEPPTNAALSDVESYRLYLGSLARSYPAIEWGLRWAELHAPDPGETVLVHRDFRTGNYLVEAGKVAAILDWEFADWGDPMSDVGWFCAACWRFGRPELEGGGVGGRQDFYRGYEAQSGRRIDPERVAYWEIMAHIRWCIIALQQGARFTEGEEESLDLALVGRIRPDELSYAILKMTPPASWRRS
jgi:aminoglycoside phosphotransferase (APT) family kinase protein